MKILKTKILFLLIFCFIFFIGMNICLAVTSTPATANSASTQGLEFTPEVSIPGFPKDVSITANGALLGKVIKEFYNYIVWLAGILAVIVIMIAGFQWVAAAGNQSKIGEAKERITGAIIGLVLALSSYMLLNIINPKLVEIQDLSELVPITAMGTYCMLDQYVSYNGQDIIGSDLECNHKANILDGRGKKTDFTCGGLSCIKYGIHHICYEKQCRGIYTVCGEAFEKNGEQGIQEINNLVSYYNKIDGECVHWQTRSSNSMDPYDNVGFCDESVYNKIKNNFYRLIKKPGYSVEKVCNALSLYATGVDLDVAACHYLICEDIPECFVGEGEAPRYSTTCKAK